MMLCHLNSSFAYVLYTHNGENCQVHIGGKYASLDIASFVIRFLNFLKSETATISPRFLDTGLISRIKSSLH